MNNRIDLPNYFPGLSLLVGADYYSVNFYANISAINSFATVNNNYYSTLLMLIIIYHRSLGECKLDEKIMHPACNPYLTTPLFVVGITCVIIERKRIRILLS